jgi:hypothetical protein
MQKQDDSLEAIDQWAPDAEQMTRDLNDRVDGVLAAVGRWVNESSPETEAEAALATAYREYYACWYTCKQGPGPEPTVQPLDATRRMKLN